MQEKYKVDLNSVLGCQMDDYDLVEFCEDFDKAKVYALVAFKTGLLPKSGDTARGP